VEVVPNKLTFSKRSNLHKIVSVVIITIVLYYKLVPIIVIITVVIYVVDYKRARITFFIT